MKKIFVILFACLSLSAFGQELEPITTTNLRVIINRINTLQGLIENGGSGGVSEQWVRGEINDSIVGRISKGIDLDTELAGYATQDQLSGREPALGNPAQNGYVLSSTTGGVRSWIAPPQGGGSEYDDTAINSRIDSLGAVVAALQIEAQDLRDEVNNLWAALAKLGDFDLVPPRFHSAEVGLHADDIVVITLDTADVDLTSLPPATAFTLWSDGTEHTIASTAFESDSLIYLTLDSAAVYGRVYTLDYTKGTPALKDPAGNETANWTGRTVVNNVAEPEPELENLIYNGDFTLGSVGWTIDEELEEIFIFSDGKCNIGRGNTMDMLQAPGDMILPIQENTNYVLSFTLTNSSGSLAIQDGANAAIYVANTEYGVGTHQVYFNSGTYSYPTNPNISGICIVFYIWGDGYSIDDIELYVDEN